MKLKGIEEEEKKNNNVDWRYENNFFLFTNLEI